MQINGSFLLFSIEKWTLSLTIDREYRGPHGSIASVLFTRVILYFYLSIFVIYCWQKLPISLLSNSGASSFSSFDARHNRCTQSHVSFFTSGYQNFILNLKPSLCRKLNKVPSFWSGYEASTSPQGCTTWAIFCRSCCTAQRGRLPLSLVEFPFDT